MKHVQESLAKRKKEHNLRKLPAQREGIDFLSNDYLGLAKNATDLVHSTKGSTGSRLLSGNHPFLEETEAFIAETHQAETALFFPSGYMANLGLYSCLASKHDTYILDEQSHASIIDGKRLSLAKTLKFKHQDFDSLIQKLNAARGEKFVVTESVFSMSGSRTDLEKLSEICKEHKAYLIIDEAHSVGLEDFNNPYADVRVVTYGKAFGVHGASVLCSQEVKDFLVNFSRPFIYSTAPSLSAVQCVKNAYQNILKADSHRAKLNKLIQYWNERKNDKLAWLDSDSQIQSLLVEGNEEVTSLANYIQENGFQVLPIKSPTVKKGEERIRFCLHSFNTESEIDHLFKVIDQWHEE